MPGHRRSTPGFPGQDKNDAPAVTEALAPELGDLQERLYAHGRVGGGDVQNILIILQGMDTSGKGGVIRHAIGMVDPQGVKIKAFKAPTAEERRHQFLWRITRELPPPGIIGIFDRSQYEDVLVVRVNELATKSGLEPALQLDQQLGGQAGRLGTVIIKCFLHISPDEQTARLLARLDDPSKHWKYNPDDVDERAKWPAYTDAYAAALELLQHRGGAVVRHPLRPQVVPQLGRGPAAGRAPAGPQPQLAGRRLRRGDREGSTLQLIRRGLVRR